ncbi:hypothetical protein OXYTRIMIC_544 [Oxytricha trifallax]|uniref:Uncharacterized protein n=1 Tax=Oxytricha trifallax TaxID=1172189 RepID=A0A073HZW1_9SPIT|nr:hypothetical protein OXYTRIMIC_544 [Oxytricha trifallax]
MRSSQSPRTSDSKHPFHQLPNHYQRSIFQVQHQAHNINSSSLIDPKQMVVQEVKHQPGLTTMIGLTAISNLAVMSLEYLDRIGNGLLQDGDLAAQRDQQQSHEFNTMAKYLFDQYDLRDGIENYMNSKITPNQRLALTRKSPGRLKAQIETRNQKILKLFKEGYQCASIAGIFGIKQTVVKKILMQKEVPQSQATMSKNATKLNPNFNKAIQQIIGSMRQSGVVITTKIIREELKNKFGFNLSKYHVIKCFKNDFGLIYHKVTLITPNHNTTVSKLA